MHYQRSNGLRRSEDGYIQVFDLDGNIHEMKTFQCRHCGSHEIVIPGSGRARSWCDNCGGPTCGKIDCLECVPEEKRLDMIEAGCLIETGQGLIWLQSPPVTVSVSHEVPTA